jgi:predicted dehydrogenase
MGTGPRIRLGLAGLGIHGRRYAEHLLRGEAGAAALVAIWRRNERAGRAFASQYGLRFVGDLEELATAADLDAVVAALPPDLHERIARSAIAAGKPLLVEKPLASSGRTAREIARAARARGAFLMVAHTLRFDPLIRALKEEIPSVGILRLVAINQRFEPSGRAWLDEPGRGGAILNTGVHAFDLLRYLTAAEAVSVVAEAASAVTERTEDEFAAIVRLEPGGLIATVDNCRATAGRSGRIEIAGERAQLRADHIHRWLYRIEGRDETKIATIGPTPTVVGALKAFVGAIRDGLPPPVGAEEGAVAVEIAEAALRSARLGRRVSLEEIRLDSAPDLP